jgi:hypothetical protein
MRYFLTALGRNSEAGGETIVVDWDNQCCIEIALQYLNQLIAQSVALIREAGLLSPEAWALLLIWLSPHTLSASFALPTQYLAQTINPTLAPFSPLYTPYGFENPQTEHMLEITHNSNARLFS